MHQSLPSSLRRLYFKSFQGVAPGRVDFLSPLRACLVIAILLRVQIHVGWVQRQKAPPTFTDIDLARIVKSRGRERKMPCYTETWEDFSKAAEKLIHSNPWEVSVVFMA